MRTKKASGKPATPAEAKAALRAVHLLADVITQGHVLFLTSGRELPDILRAMRAAGVSYREMPAVEGEP